MTVVDSPGWIELFTDGPLADAYESRLRDAASILVPAIVIDEVYKRLKRDLSEDDALIAVSAIQRSRVIPVDQEVALTAVDLSLEHGLAMADSLVLATARLHDADLLTSDRDFEGLAGVIDLPKPSAG
ncbi:MAG: uncharacterized protein JWN02_2422 [Acidobacteria bacterium]|nr:uncharacterized protein [Acidobacteriota bacterium]